jgi:Cu-Zn family superoxide dismutase
MDTRHDSIASFARLSVAAIALLATAVLGSAARAENAPADRAGSPPVAKEVSPSEPQELDIGGLAQAAAEADLKVAGRPSMKGNARFEQVDDGVTVLVAVEGAPPGNLGVHVHEKGDCSDIPGKSMGEHFAPRGEPHGLPSAPRRHIGDLGNMVVDQNGRGELKIVAEGANLEKQDPLSFLNRAIVIHEGQDKGTQPSGDAGKPLACGVIEEG